MKKTTLLLLAACIFCNICATAQVFTPIDVRTGTAGSNPRWFTELNGKVYFTATTDAAGFELWGTDGTQAGTALIKDINPGAADASITTPRAMGGKLYFSANDGVNGNELWSTDGTPAGTAMVLDINPGIADAYPGYLTVMGNKLYFAAITAAKGYELWVTDGTPAGTSLLKDINPGSAGSSIAAFVGERGVVRGAFNEYNGKLYFRATDDTHGSELWATDGTSAGTTMIADIWPGINEGIPFMMTELGGRLIFTAQDNLHSSEVWISDGTTAGTSLLKDINPGSDGSSAAALTGYVELNGKLYFCAREDATGYELWSTDGTSAGTAMVKDIWAGPGSSRAGDDYTLVKYNNKLYFAATDSLNGTQLWSSDGTPAGTALLKVLSATTPYDAQPHGMIEYNGQLIFTAQARNATGQELYTTDGTAAGTHLIAPAIAPTADPLVININGIPLATANGDLYMNANFTNIGLEVWKYSTPSTAITEAAGDHSISAYPNPFATGIHLSGLETGKSYSIRITDLSGRECHTTAIDHSTGSVILALPDWTAGVYLMQVAGMAESHTFRIVKQ